MSAQTKRQDIFNLTNAFDKRISVTAAETRTQNNLFTPQEMENIKLNNLRHKRRQLQDKLKLVANRINYKRKKQEQQLKKFIRSEQKSLSLMETQNYKKYNDMLKEQFEQRKTFQMKKRARDVEEARRTSNRRLSLIQQSIRDKKQEDYEKGRRLKKMDEDIIKQSRDMALSLRKQQHQSINKMKQKQQIKRRCYWFQKRLSFQQKLLEDAQIYEKQIEEYYRKIQAIKQNEEQLKQQQKQAAQVLRCAQQNYQLLKQS